MADLSSLEMVVRLSAGGGLAALVGLERELDAQPAGFRTHLLVGLGSALFTVTGAAVTGSDPTRVAAQVVTGIGFLGAGAILRDGPRIKGLTTAATLWLSASIGVACGLGDFAPAAVVTVVALIALRGLKRVERRALPSRGTTTLSVDIVRGASLSNVVRAVESVTGPLRVREVARSGEAGERIVGTVKLAGRLTPLQVLDQLLALEGVAGVDLRA